MLLLRERSCRSPDVRWLQRPPQQEKKPIVPQYLRRDVRRRLAFAVATRSEPMSQMDLLKTYNVERVLADPAKVWPPHDFGSPPRYLRLHGKPKIYYYSYTNDEIKSFQNLLAPETWCVFDNTAAGNSVDNALTMLDMLSKYVGNMLLALSAIGNRTTHAFDLINSVERKTGCFDVSPS
nr:DUF72 domain-containing protein [Rhizobium sp. Leaf321]